MKKMSRKAISLLVAIQMILGVAMIPWNFTTAQAATVCPVSQVDTAPTGLQANVTFPDWAGYVDDTLLMNGMYSFKAYAGQGELYITCSDNLQSVNFFINGIKVDVSEACKNNGKIYKVDISNATVNGTNTIQVTNCAPGSGKVNVKIPFPTVVADSSVDVNQDKLDLINLMIQKDVQYGYSGGQLAVIKNGVMIVDSAYGTLNTYNQDGTKKTDSPAVTTNTLFDLASNTKMYATNYALQKLVSEKKIDINDKITKYFPDFKDGDSDPFKGKAELTLKNLMEHQGGFPADPQYHNDKYNQATQKSDASATNPLFSQDKTTTLQMILKTPLSYIPGTKTVYSDVDYMLLGLVVEKITGQQLDDYVEKNIYKPMGLNHILYNPLQKGFAKNDCAATELNGNTRDGAISFQNIRTDTIQGEVHDEKAYYSMDGVSGHAGLFANAGDLAKLCQVMLNGGGYGDNKFFDKNTIDEFTKRKDTLATWGLGWWREGDNGRVYYFGSQSSSDTYGHQGWTGTLTCIDPKNDLVIVWLSHNPNSPVIDNTVYQNKFTNQKFTSSTYGSLTTMIYDAMGNDNPEAIEANLASMVTEKIKLVKSETSDKFKQAVIQGACALTDTLITRAEQRKVQSLVNYSNAAVDELSADCTNTALLSGFKDRISKIQASADSKKDFSKINVKEIDTAPSAQWRADISFPDYMDYVDDTLICNNMFTFKGYAGQGKLYITAQSGVTSFKVYINGVEMNTTSLCNNIGSTYEVDYSKIAVNGNNTIQVSNIAPSSISFKQGVNVKIPYPTVLEGNSTSVGADQDKLNLIDTIINNDVKYGFTSAQLAIIKDGVLIKNSAYGTTDAYNQDGSKKTDSPAVTKDTLYDLASNTKMYSTNYALQKLVSEGKININDKITKYFPDFKDGDSDPFKGKAELTLKNLMEHQGGFPADPQYHNDKFNQATQKADVSVTNPLFSQDKATTLQMILKTPLSYIPGTKTVYSDVDYMLLGLVVEKVTGQQLDDYVEKNIYQPMGLNHILFNPLQKGFTKNDCASTELNGNTRDGAISFQNIRTNTLQGEVHDEKAYYAMDGVSGHAGLFANAGDLAKLCQVMLNGGGYGDNKFFDQNTLDQFTKRKDTLATWGLGWWREGDNGRPWYFGVQSSSGTFGHQGWTGTLTMIDPSSNLVIVLLTNKINSPVIDNTKNANTFYGNKFTTATLGTIPLLAYEAFNKSSTEALNANVAQMVTEKLKLYDPNNFQANAILNATYSLVDTAVTRAEALKTSETLAYAQQAVNKLDLQRDKTQVALFTNRLAAINAPHHTSTHNTASVAPVTSNPIASITGSNNVLIPGKESTFTINSEKSPSITCGDGSVAQVKVVKPWDAVSKTMQLEVYTTGQPGKQTGIYATIDGVVTKLFVVTVGAKAPYTCDTTLNVSKKPAQTYWFKITSQDKQKKPVFTVGNGSILQTMSGATVTNKDGTTTYYFGYKCLNSGSCGVYISINGVTNRVFSANVL